MAFQYAYALTGGIATGKSTVIERMAECGFRVIDADKVAHEVLDEEAEQIKILFGEIFVNDGKVDRKMLGTLVFSDAEKRKKLEALLHPLIYKKIEATSEKLDKRAEPYLVDIPLFYEGGRYPIANVVVVYARPEQQLERALERDGLTKEEAQARIDAQIDIDEKRDNALYVIDNSGTLAQLMSEIERVKEEISKEIL